MRKGFKQCGTIFSLSLSSLLKLDDVLTNVPVCIEQSNIKGLSSLRPATLVRRRNLLQETLVVVVQNLKVCHEIICFEREM